MLALTLKHPWPWAIAILGKRIENRTWHPGSRLRVGGWFAIHGGKWPSSASELEDLHFRAASLANDYRDRLPGGDASLLDVMAFSGVSAVAKFGGVVLPGSALSSDPWFEGPVGWLMTEVVALPEPVPCRGAQGLWPLPPDVLARVRDQFRAATVGPPTAPR